MTPDRRGASVLPRSFYDRPTLDVARDLLAKVVVHRTSRGVTAGAIVEAEAYIGESDPACHAARGPTPRNDPMYGPPGTAYVYLSYGVHHLFNVVTEGPGVPSAVLIRALAPLTGVPLMRQRRDGRDLSEHLLCRGPGNLTKAMGITLARNRAVLQPVSSLWIEDRGLELPTVVWTPRIGISTGQDRRWRCYAAGDSRVSGLR